MSAEFPPAVTPQEMGRLDRLATERYGIPSLLLMENAGQSAFRSLLDRFRLSPAARIYCICGRGNNGGDGFVVARHAHNAGLKTLVLVAGARSSHEGPGDAARNLEILERMGVPTLFLEDEFRLPNDVGPPDTDSILVDALLGTGLRGEVRGISREAIAWIRAAAGRKVALDIPSGLDGTTGEILGDAVRADLTVTFARPKIGLFRASGPDCAGEIDVVPISIPREELEAADSAASDA